MLGVALLFLLVLFWVQLVQAFSPLLMQLTSARYIFCRVGIVLIILWFWQNPFLLLFPPHLHSKPCWPVSSSAESIPEMLPLQFCQPGWLPSLSPCMCWPHWTPPCSSSTFSSPRNRRDLGAKDLVHTVLQDKWERAIMYFKKAETSFSKKALKLSHCSALSSSFYLVKIIPVQQAPLLLTLYFLENKDTQNWRGPPGLLSQGTPASESILCLHDPFLKFMRFLLKAKYVLLKREATRLA